MCICRTHARIRGQHPLRPCFLRVDYVYRLAGLGACGDPPISTSHLIMQPPHYRCVLLCPALPGPCEPNSGPYCLSSISTKPSPPEVHFWNLFLEVEFTCCVTHQLKRTDNFGMVPQTEPCAMSSPVCPGSAL